jgi:hypothetical protein
MTYRICNLGSITDVNTVYWKTILDPIRPQLILTSKNDRIIDRSFIQTYTKDKKNINHIEFNTGTHANIYRYNLEKYSADVQQFINS